MTSEVFAFWAGGAVAWLMVVPRTPRAMRSTVDWLISVFWCLVWPISGAVAQLVRARERKQHGPQD